MSLSINIIPQKNYNSQKKTQLNFSGHQFKFINKTIRNYQSMIKA